MPDRFNQLIEKAREGDSCAIADLWHEFQFDFYSDTLGGSSSEAGGEKSSSGESA
jgi:hypothetical protein